jgi:hypothetical protein
VLVPYREFNVSSNYFCLNSSLVQSLICVEIFNILMFCLSSRRWFVLCLGFIHHLGAGTRVTPDGCFIPRQTGRLTVGRNITLRLRYTCPEIGTSSIDWAQLSRFHLKTEWESSLRNVVLKYKQEGVLDKNKAMDNVQKHNICSNLESSQTFRSY